MRELHELKFQVDDAARARGDAAMRAEIQAITSEMLRTSELSDARKAELTAKFRKYLSSDPESVVIRPAASHLPAVVLAQARASKISRRHEAPLNDWCVMPDRATMLDRLLRVSRMDVLVTDFYPRLLLHAGEEIHGGGVILWVQQYAYELAAKHPHQKDLLLPMLRSMTVALLKALIDDDAAYSEAVMFATPFIQGTDPNGPNYWRY